MVFYGFMGFTQLPPQHSQFFQKLSSRRPDLRNPVLLGCHWYLTCASCVCIFMYFPRMTVWRFFFSFRFFLMTVFHERPPVISRVPRLNRVSVHPRPPLECDSIDSIWRFHMAPGQKLMMKLGMIRSNKARLGQLFWGLELFGCGFHQTSSPSWPVVISFRPTQHFKHAMASSGLIWQLILSQRARRAGPRGSRSPMCVYLRWRLA